MPVGVTGTVGAMAFTAQTIADRYAALWNEPDDDRRRAEIHDLWAADAVHALQPPTEIRDAVRNIGFERSSLQARGHDALEFRVRRAYDEFVAPGTFRFRPRPDAERLDDVVKFHWEMLGPNDVVAAVGLEILVLDADGRISRDYQFLE